MPFIYNEFKELFYYEFILILEVILTEVFENEKGTCSNNDSFSNYIIFYKLFENGPRTN
jgi:hypothetical protein